MKAIPFSELQEYRYGTFNDLCVLFSDVPVLRGTLPEGVFAYDVRFSDTEDYFATIEYNVRARYAGTILTTKPIDMDGDTVYHIHTYSFSNDNTPIEQWLTTNQKHNTMNRQKLLSCIETMLLCKDEGEHHLHTFECNSTVYPSTFQEARKKGVINFFSSNTHTIDHRLYEIFVGNNKTVILSTYSYTIPVMELSYAELITIYEEMIQLCTNHGESICK